MAVATGTALALGAGASALGGYLNSRNMQSASAPYIDPSQIGNYYDPSKLAQAQAGQYSGGQSAFQTSQGLMDIAAQQQQLGSQMFDRDSEYQTGLRTDISKMMSQNVAQQNQSAWERQAAFGGSGAMGNAAARAASAQGRESAMNQFGQQSRSLLGVGAGLLGQAQQGLTSADQMNMQTQNLNAQLANQLGIARGNAMTQANLANTGQQNQMAMQRADAMASAYGQNITNAANLSNAQQANQYNWLSNMGGGLMQMAAYGGG